MNKKLIFFASLVLLVGAGCASNVVTPPNGAPPEQVIPESPSAQVTPPSEPVTPPPATPTSPTNEKTMPKTWSFPGILPASEIHGKQIRIQTAKGDIVFKLYDTESPKTVSNFVYLAENGFYDGLTFHRIVPGFVIQGGDPNGNGSGGPGYQFADELPPKRDYMAGTVAMANSGPDTNGSQFFIDLVDHPAFDGPKYTIFGQVTQGLDVVQKIAAGDVMTKVTVEPLK
jgi:cyclophilin family peptidyl-prolyl cis-trans isomerase